MSVTKTAGFRKSYILGAVSAVALLAAGPVMAANQVGDGAEVRSSTQVLIKAEDLVGKGLENYSGEEIGDIESVILDENGEVRAVVVSVGGFLGIGDREVALDWNGLNIRESGDVIRSDLSKSDLEALPEYEYKSADQRGAAFVDKVFLEAGNDRTYEPIPAGQLNAQKLIGAEVVGVKGESIGAVEDVIVTDGKTQLVLSVGQFLGMGGHEVALDMDKVEPRRQRGDTDDLRVVVSMTKEQIKGLPKYSSEKTQKPS
ncbi:MAG: PRC-barrel domain-containing protein [Alphaproteobacteria bacterium]|nr:PRC-barrel domain-containing protein [Alphaproteobacteria bacterium]